MKENPLLKGLRNFIDYEKVFKWCHYFFRGVGEQWPSLTGSILKDHIKNKRKGRKLWEFLFEKSRLKRNFSSVVWKHVLSIRIRTFFREKSLSRSLILKPELFFLVPLKFSHFSRGVCSKNISSDLNISKRVMFYILKSYLDIEKLMAHFYLIFYLFPFAFHNWTKGWVP